MQTVFITGASGFLGGKLFTLASSKWKVSISYYLTSLESQNSFAVFHLDIRDKNRVADLISQISPRLIIHTAAITNSDSCAKDRKTAWEVNVKGTENIVLAANLVQAKVIYLSSDSVFSGDKGFYSETDRPEPISFYGKTKLEGERIVSSLTSNFCIVRSSLLYGWSCTASKCFAEIMIMKLRQGKEVHLFADEYRSPIYVDNLCEILMELAEMKNVLGTYHVCGSERLSRFDFGLKMCDIFKFNRKLIVPISVNDFQFIDKRPRDCSMRNTKALGTVKKAFLGVDEGLAEMKKAFLGTL